MDEMLDERIAALEHYFLNARRFMWNLPFLPKPKRDPKSKKPTEKSLNQDFAYKWLEKVGREKGFEFNRGSYKSVERQLLKSPGIERIVKDVIVPKVNELFTEQQLNFLRDCWMSGNRPEYSFLAFHKIDDPDPFLVVNQEFKYCESWGEFAGVFFEEIERIDAIER